MSEKASSNLLVVILVYIYTNPDIFENDIFISKCFPPTLVFSSIFQKLLVHIETSEDA